MIKASGRGLMLLDPSQGSPHVYVRGPEGPYAPFACVLRVDADHYEPIVHDGKCVLRRHSDALQVMRIVASAPALMPRRITSRGDAPAALLVAKVGGYAWDSLSDSVKVCFPYFCDKNEGSAAAAPVGGVGSIGALLTFDQPDGGGAARPRAHAPPALPVPAALPADLPTLPSTRETELDNSSSRQQLRRVASSPELLLAWAREWLRPKPPNAAWAERISTQTLSIADFTLVLYTCTPDHLHAWARWLTDQACDSLTVYASSVDQVRTLASPSPSPSPSTLALALAFDLYSSPRTLTLTRYPHPHHFAGSRAHRTRSHHSPRSRDCQTWRSHALRPRCVQASGLRGAFIAGTRDANRYVAQASHCACR